MVVTDLPFDRKNCKPARYSNANRATSAPPTEGSNDKDSQEYAKFLREKERKVGPDGFLDSSRFTHPYGSTGSGKSPRPKSDTSPRGGVIHLTRRKEKEQREFDKRIKVIEDHMWQHKQEERELKRNEGDIVKNQRALRSTLRSYETAITKKRVSEEKKLSHSMEKYSTLKKENLHAKEDRTKERIERTQLKEQDDKSKGRKVACNISDLARRYQTKKSEIELKRVEVMRLNQEYERKLNQKEQEQFLIKKELAELSIALNMEAQKGSQEKSQADRVNEHTKNKNIQENLETERNYENKLGKSDGDIKAAQMQKRRLSADLALTKARLAIKGRDEQRHLRDTRVQLEDNSTKQRQLNEAAMQTDLEMRAKHIDQRVEAHNAKRVTMMQQNFRQKKEKEEAQQTVWEERFRQRHSDQQLQEHQDSLKFLEKNVRKGEDTERILYNKVRNNEISRQQREQSVKRMERDLQKLKDDNSRKLNQEAIEASRSETELAQKLYREQAELLKVHARREESYLRLQKQRETIKEDQYQLEKEEREHDRLKKIQARNA